MIGHFPPSISSQSNLLPIVQCYCLGSGGPVLYYLKKIARELEEVGEVEVVVVHQAETGEGMVMGMTMLDHMDLKVLVTEEPETDKGLKMGPTTIPLMLNVRHIIRISSHSPTATIRINNRHTHPNNHMHRPNHTINMVAADITQEDNRTTTADTVVMAGEGEAAAEEVPQGEHRRVAATMEDTPAMEEGILMVANPITQEDMEEAVPVVEAEADKVGMEDTETTKARAMVAEVVDPMAAVEADIVVAAAVVRREAEDEVVVVKVAVGTKY